MSDPDASSDLAASYRRCRDINRAHGTTYYWSTRTLPREKQPHVFAVYAFCRIADDIVDDMDATTSPGERAAALAAFGERFLADLHRGSSDHEMLAAAVATTLESASIRTASAGSSRRWRWT